MDDEKWQSYWSNKRHTRCMIDAFKEFSYSEFQWRVISIWIERSSN